ncbi:ribosome recycling factor [Malassezia pachydermatis]|uniref:Ribosome recycling factor n=1 Tax=Malassezia pachydermatis TaxID=77020 RepID=A0A0M8MT40_9BASI|nr:ribosome recycling factor [Malassezia pachydermatis]KOS13240.1 ribosome recycling factor [Malassezia pachydermatis]
MVEAALESVTLAMIMSLVRGSIAQHARHISLLRASTLSLKHAIPVTRIQPIPLPRQVHSSLPLAKKKGKQADKAEAAAAAGVDPQLDLDAINKQMDTAVARCREHVQSLVASLGRLDASLLDDVRVAYGKGTKPTPLHDYATVGVRDNVLVITAYEPESLKYIEKAIYAANKDLSPQHAPEEGEGVMIVHVPKATGETRKQLAQQCVKECDHAKAAVRTARQAAQKHMKHDMDHKILSKNESQKESKKLEDMTKKHTALLDQLASDAQKRLLH